MWRDAPYLWLAAVAGCAGQAPSVSSVGAPEPARDLPPRAIQAPTVQPTRYQQDVDDLLRALAEQDAAGGEVAASSTAARAAYDENLAICLDGRWLAFCDHELLSPYDKTRVISAEHAANQVTCIDPQWQHLCRPELLPALP